MRNKDLSTIQISQWSLEELATLKHKRVQVSIGNLQTGVPIQGRAFPALVLDLDLRVIGPIVYLRSELELSQEGGYIMEVAVKTEKYVYVKILESVSLEELLTHPDSLTRNFITKQIKRQLCTSS